MEKEFSRRQVLRGVAITGAGEWMGLSINWSDSRRLLTIELAEGSRMLPPARRNLEIKPGHATRRVIFEGHKASLQL